jgi:hypothetical protein
LHLKRIFSLLLICFSLSREKPAKLPRTPKTIHWKLLKLPDWEASHNSRFEPGIPPQNLFSK